MASDPANPDIPVGDPQSGMSVDAPYDVDFNATLARSQAGLIAIGGLMYQSNEDLKTKMQILGKGPYAPVASKPSE